MGKKIFVIGFFLVLILILPKSAAAVNVAGHSAVISYSEYDGDNIDYHLKKMTIKRVLERYDSPIADQADAFIDTCKKTGIDCYLLPSITGVESTFAKFMISGTYNPFGWGKGTIPFKSWADGIDTVGVGLKENYIDKGATSVDQIGAIYCEGNTWAGKVKYFMSQFSKEEEKINLFFSNDKVEL